MESKDLKPSQEAEANPSLTAPIIKLYAKPLKKIAKASARQGVLLAKY